MKPLVSVTVTTYQQRDYIRKCLDGILMQQTDFPYEIIIGEDGSDDGTREICMDYATRHPDKIRLFLRDRKTSQFYDERGELVIRFNGIWNRMSARGKYIAWCEGDDYWLDPTKLQRQADHLERHSACVLHHTQYIVVNEMGEEIKEPIRRFFWSRHQNKKGNILKRLVKRNTILPATVMVNKKALNQAQSLVFGNSDGIKVIDYSLFLGVAMQGEIYFDHSVTTAYRRLPNSFSHSTDLEVRLRFIQDVFSIARHFNQIGAVGLRSGFFDRSAWSAIMREHALRGDVAAWRSTYVRACRHSMLNALSLRNHFYFLQSLWKRK